MRMPSLLKSTLIAAAATVMSAGAALAGPLGINLPQTFYLDNSASYETLVQNPGVDVLKGMFKVTSISDSSTSNLTYTYGQGGKFLTGVFNNFLFTGTTSDAGGLHLFFTGGYIEYWVNNANIFNNHTGNITNDLATASAGSLWLRALPSVIDGAGHTLEITITAGTLGSFSKSSVQAFLDVDGSNPGAAGYLFDTNTYNGHDIDFGGKASSSATGACGDFGVCGANSAASVLVPEPITVSLFGAGLAGAAFVRRRKAKKA